MGHLPLQDFSIDTVYEGVMIFQWVHYDFESLKCMCKIYNSSNI